MLALVDCNNFFVSCERISDPVLEKIPVAVLSSNDGVVIARSNEVKAMGIPMGAPYFKYRELMEQRGVKIISGEHRYYIDISRKVMKILGEFSPRMEVYSIDEAFLCLKGFEHMDLKTYGKSIKDSVAESIGIPVSVGIAETKTLAKIASEKAKKDPDMDGVVVIDNLNREEILKNTPIEDVWGVGRQTTKKMYFSGIGTAYDLTCRPNAWIRQKFSIGGLRTASELNGLKCYSVHNSGRNKPHQSIVVSSSFGRKITKLEDLQEAIANFISKAAEKLRRDSLLVCNLTVFLNNNRFLPPEHSFKRDITIKLPYPTDNTAILVRYARKLIKDIYKQGILYQRCGVVLTELESSEEEQGELFDKRTSTQRLKQKNQVQVIDELNYRFGRGTIFHASQGTKREWRPNSKLRKEHKTVEKEVYSTRFF